MRVAGTASPESASRPETGWLQLPQGHVPGADENHQQPAAPGA